MIVYALAFVGVAFFFNTLRKDIVHALALLASIFAGFAFTFLVGRDNTDGNAFGNIVLNALCTELASVVVFWIGIIIIDLTGSHSFSMFATIFLTPILIAIMMAVSSIIIGLIIYGISKLL